MKKKVFCAVCLSSFLLCACGKTTDPLPNDKTIIRVYGYAGGFGGDWIKNFCEEFAEREKDTSYEEGKTGVYFVYTLNKDMPNSSLDILPTDYDILITENAKLNEWYVDGCFEDITDVVTGANKYESGKTIESKIDEKTRGAYKWNDKYYALPTYTGNYGIVYNVDLFDELNLYYSGVNPGEFISSSLEPKSVGPDGEAGTYDDGLPVTSEDFMNLCYQIDLSQAAVPLLWSGQYKSQYATNWIYSMAASIDGEDVTRARYTFENIDEVPVVKMGSGKTAGTGDQYIIENVDVTKSNGYELYRTEGFVKAFDMLDKIVTTGNGKYTDKANCYDATVTHINAQTYFLQPKPGQKRAAMLFEGTWWRNEVKDNMARIPGSDKINFGWMPLPRLEGQTESYCLDALATAAFIKKDNKGTRSEGTLNALKDLMRFMYTDDSMVKFSISTDTYFALDYKMGSEISKLSSYGQNLFKFKESSHTHLLAGVGASDDARRNETKLRPSYTNLTFPVNSVDTNFIDYYSNNKTFNRHADTASYHFYHKYADSWWF